MNARRAAQRIDLQAGIVGQHVHTVARRSELEARDVGPQARRLTQPLRKHHRLLGRVASKCPRILDHLRRSGHIDQGQTAEPLAENGANLADLMRVACRYYAK